MDFQRWTIGSPGLNALMQHSLFQNKLKADIESGDVFPAIRSGKIDFYHLGRKLFSFDGQRFRTNAKFAFVLTHDRSGEVTEQDLAAAKIESSFEAGYQAIKQNIKLHRQPESLGVSDLCKQYSFAKKSNQFLDWVVLDVERSLVALTNPDESDRIDLVIFHRPTKQLAFVEAKCFANKELEPRDEEAPPVIRQVERYIAQVNDKAMQITDGYRTYTEIVNKLFDLDLPLPEKILPRVGLLVFEFDTSSKDEVAELQREFKSRYGISVIARGGLKNVEENTFSQKWWPALTL